MHSILLVDDDARPAGSSRSCSRPTNRHVRLGAGSRPALRLLRGDAFDLLVSDINLNALAVGPRSAARVQGRRTRPAHVLLISGFGTLETAIEAVRAGAFDYISKPFNIAEIKAMVDRALAHRRAHERARERRDAAIEHPPGLIGRTARCSRSTSRSRSPPTRAAPVLILGESGTGKELVARAIHANGPRARGRSSPSTAARFADTLLESELFGHMRGAFTGAVADRKGVFEQAAGGTVLLDEIGETTLALQVRLLRAIEEGEVRPVGGNARCKVDCARHRGDQPRSRARKSPAQRFRQDLYYRLSVIVITGAAAARAARRHPAADRRSSSRTPAPAPGARLTSPPDALDALDGVRLAGQRARAGEHDRARSCSPAAGSSIEVVDLPPAIGPRGRQHAICTSSVFADLPSLDELERRYLLHVLHAVGGNRTRAAEVLGIDRRTLYRMADRFGLDLGDE